jgi:hypothetical protein
MQPKALAVLIIGMILLLLVMPASAYDYRGVPRPGDNLVNESPSASYSDSINDLGGSDLSSLLDSSGLSTIISLILYFILQLLGISAS